MAVKFESFVISQSDGDHFQGVTPDGKKREFAVQLCRNLATNELTLVPYRHYTTPDSEPWFEDSEPWTEDERRGQDD